jgi:hypothetical protein
MGRRGAEHARVRRRGRAPAALALFRGEAGAVQVDLKERTVAFAGS